MGVGRCHLGLMKGEQVQLRVACQEGRSVESAGVGPSKLVREDFDKHLLL